MKPQVWVVASECFALSRQRDEQDSQQSAAKIEKYIFVACIIFLAVINHMHLEIMHDKM